MTQFMTESLQERVAALEAELAVLRQDLESFNYSVSHDLRAPLRAITAFTEALAEDYAAALDGQGFDYLRRVQSSAAFMEQLLDSLLELSRVSRAAVRRERVNLTEIAEGLGSVFRQHDPSREVELAVAPDLTVVADPALIQICLQHLLANAMKFSASKPVAKVEVAPHGRGFLVRDNGVGFQPEYAEKMFGAFQRLHPQSQFEGVGIGLTIVQRIVHRHQGRVWAEGKPGEGATLFVDLP